MIAYEYNTTPCDLVTRSKRVTNQEFVWTSSHPLRALSLYPRLFTYAHSKSEASGYSIISSSLCNTTQLINMGTRSNSTKELYHCAPDLTRRRRRT
jgi:hypothetical protein